MNVAGTTVSVVIPCFNHERYVAEAVESALGQTHTPAQVIVVDDGSTDGSAAALEAFGDRIQLIRQANAGVSAARNIGLAVATGDLVAFLDADDVWLPTKLERQVAALARTPDGGLVHCGMVEIDAEGREGERRTDGLEGWVLEELLLLRRSVVLGGGSGFVVPRPLLVELGGFDPSLSTSADWDLFRRVAQRHRLVFVPDVLLRYRIHGQNMHANVALFERDMTSAMAKAFAADPTRSHLRRRSEARLHLILAGSFRTTGHLVRAIRHGARAITLDPRNLSLVARATLRRR